MAIITALERAKTYLILPDKSPAIVQRVDNAEAPATREFLRKFPNYFNIKIVPDSFNPVSVEDMGNDVVKVTVTHEIAKRLNNGFDLIVTDGNYKGLYSIYSLDTTANTFCIDAEYFDEVITFENEERQIFEDALAWYIVAFCRFTLQELKINNVMLTATQLGDGSIDSFGVQSIAQFQRQLFENAHNILRNRFYPAGV